MKFSTIIDNHIKLVAERNKGTKQAPSIARKARSIMDGPGHRDEVHLTGYLTIGQVLKPLHQFKIYLNNKLETYNKTNLVVIYRIHAKHEEYTYPEHPEEDVPRCVLAVFRDVECDQILSSVGLYQVVPTITIAQLMLIACQCETVGRVDVS